MTKADIISDVSKTTGFTKVEVEVLLDSIKVSSKQCSILRSSSSRDRNFGLLHNDS